MRCIAGNKIFEECESERACNGTLDVLPHHNTLMKAQALCVNVPENCDEYKRSWEIWCVIVTKVTTTDGDSDEPIHHGTEWLHD